MKRRLELKLNCCLHLGRARRVRPWVRRIEPLASRATSLSLSPKYLLLSKQSIILLYYFCHKISIISKYKNSIIYFFFWLSVSWYVQSEGSSASVSTFEVTSQRVVVTRWYHTSRDIGYQLGLWRNPRVPLYRLRYSELVRAGILQNIRRGNGIGTDRARKVSIRMSERRHVDSWENAIDMPY